MKRIGAVLGVVFFIASLVAVVVALTAADAPQVPYLPGITVKDDFPNGCVDCHKNLGTKQDSRLNVSLAQVKNHPDIAKIVKTVPTDCMMCHKEGRNAPPLQTITHKVHYEKPSGNPFVTVNKGACLNCHAFDTAKNAMIMKSGPKNW